MRTAASLLAALLCMLSACGGGGGGGEGDSSGNVTVATAVSMPGTVTDPSGAVVSPPTGTAVLLYLWIPLDSHEPSEADLLYLADAASPSLLVLPVQPDADSRNFAQTLINGLGIPLPVCIADQAVLEALGTDVLPSALYLLPDGTSRSGNGFGCAARLLGAASED